MDTDLVTTMPARRDKGANALPVSLFAVVPPVGAVVAGHYEVEGWLGAGAMGTVLSVVHQDCGRRAALKILAADAARNPASTQALMREAAWASRVRHPNVIRILDWGVDESLRLPFIAMERIEGQTLRSLLKHNEALSLLQRLELCAQLATALAACHEQRLVHLDIKPENVMVADRPDGGLHATLIDFGLVYSLDQSADPTSTRAGTLAYMSPEQVLGHRVDQRADLFAFGCVLHELLTGAVPFSIRERLTKWFDGVRFAIPKLQTVGDAAVDPILTELHAALLEPDPANRPRSALDVASVLVASAATASQSRPARAAGMHEPAAARRGEASEQPTVRRARLAMAEPRHRPHYASRLDAERSASAFVTGL